MQLREQSKSKVGQGLVQKCDTDSGAILEQYFALFDARFAQYFFGLTLEGDLLNPASSWGGLVGLGAKPPKYEWNPTRPGCYLVPLILDHEDNRQIKKNKKLFRQGKGSIEKLRLNSLHT